MRKTEDSAALPASTARTAKGQVAMDNILDAALDLLTREGLAALSMRKVADRLNMRLSALQYHFPTWEILLQAMVSKVQDQYTRVIQGYMDTPTLSRQQQFEKVLGYLLRDIKSPPVQSVFAQLWALAQTNAFSREVMTRLYAYERSVFEFFIKELNPSLPRKEVVQRAALMVTQIEGLMLLIPQQTRFPRAMAGIEQLCAQQIISLAHAPPRKSGRRSHP